MGNTNIMDTIKWCNRHTKKLKYCSCVKFDENRNKFGKLWSPDSELITGTNLSILPTFRIYLSCHPLIKDNIFEVAITYPPRGTPIGIVSQYCEHHNMSYISQSK